MSSGSITSKTGTPGAVAGAGGTTSTIVIACFWNYDTAPGLQAVGDGLGSITRCLEKSTEEMSTATADIVGELIFLLNYNNSPEEERIWKRSDLRNDGYPVFASGELTAVTWEDVGGKAMAPRSKDLTSPGTAGQESNPYQIMSAEELAWFALQVNNGTPGLCAELKADINLFGGLYSGFAYDTGDPDIINQAIQWIPIGSDADGKRYTGTFNGNGHVITAMRAKGTEKQGLFGTLGDNAAIRKTSISDSRIEVTLTYAGGIAGYVNGTGIEITECGNKGSLSVTGSYTGGCVGFVDVAATDLILDGCYNAGTISVPGGDGVGGIIGCITGNRASPVIIRNCMNKGTVEGQSVVSGIIGTAGTGGIRASGCWNAGTVSASIGSYGAASIIFGYSGGADDIRDCLVDETHKYGDIGNCLTVKPEALGTWGAAWWLNGGSLKQSTGLSWTYDKDSAYPVLSATGLSSAESWEQIGEALEYGLLKDMETPAGDGNTDPYQIQTAEQLAWFARKVNVEHISSSNQNIELTKDSISLEKRIPGILVRKILPI